MDDKISKEDARAGEKNGHVRYILYISLTLAIIAMVLAVLGVL